MIWIFLLDLYTEYFEMPGEMDSYRKVDSPKRSTAHLLVILCSCWLFDHFVFKLTFCNGIFFVVDHFSFYLFGGFRLGLLLFLVNGWHQLDLFLNIFSYRVSSSAQASSFSLCCPCREKHREPRRRHPLDRPEATCQTLPPSFWWCSPGKESTLYGPLNKFSIIRTHYSKVPFHFQTLFFYCSSSPANLPRR